jgi:hypothetical protein
VLSGLIWIVLALVDQKELRGFVDEASGEET